MLVEKGFHHKWDIDIVKQDENAWESLYTAYNIVPTVNNNMLYTYKCIKRVDLMFNVLVTIKQIKMNKLTIQLESGQRDSLKKIYRFQINTWQTCKTSLSIKEMHIQTTMRYHYISIWMAKIKVVTTQTASRDIEKLHHLYIVVKSVKCYSHTNRKATWLSFFWSKTK